MLYSELPRPTVSGAFLFKASGHEHYNPIPVRGQKPRTVRTQVPLVGLGNRWLITVRGFCASRRV